MEKKPLVPRNVIDIEGKILYNENNRAWNTIRLRSDILKEFNKLKEKKATFSYEMMYFRSAEELEKLVRKIKMNKAPLPILMFLYEDKE
jgi:hypothetical protein